MDKFTRKKRSQIMSRIRSAGTLPELKIKKFAKVNGFSYQPKKIYGKPDFANKKFKVLIFIDGCFWHGCKKHYIAPKSNVSFWKFKVDRNMRQDKKVTRKLRNEGWKVIRIWEHRLKGKTQIKRVEERISDSLKKRNLKKIL